MGKITPTDLNLEIGTSVKDGNPGTIDQDILLTEEDKQRLYAPWIHSVIVKLVKSNFNHRYLKGKLEELWNLQEPLSLVDLGMGFYTAKLSKAESQSSILMADPGSSPALLSQCESGNQLRT
ncbi:hypothetical protein BC332_02077 [Capsicum chinense]|nr:hypothetical protein BC332_02077 [Capsicum chinense]